jgi:branched-chain amino acid transport system substrate-binding protein
VIIGGKIKGGVMMKKTVLLSLSLTFFVGLFMVCPLAHAQNSIKVGIVDTYTGPATTFTMDVLDGFKLAVNDINAKGGVLGKKIEYTTRDEKFKPDIGLAMAKELVLKENVDILMGTINSATTLAISDFVKKKRSCRFL